MKEIIEDYQEQQFILFKKVFKELMVSRLNDYDVYDEIEIFSSFLLSNYAIYHNPQSKKEILQHDLQKKIIAMSEALVIGQAWQIGGMEGGNYNDGEAKPYVLTGEDRIPKMPFILDDFLKKVAPDLTHVQYNEMLLECPIKEREDSKSEYYGNRQDFILRYIELTPVFQYLSNLNILLTAEQIANIETNENNDVSPTKRKKIEI